MAREFLSVAICQMTSVDDLRINSENIQRNILTAVNLYNDLRFISFPENCLYLQINKESSLPTLLLDDPIFLPLVKIARSCSIYIHLGSIALKRESGVENASVIITPGGDLNYVYSKIHLFDVDIEGHGIENESRIFRHGAGPQTYTVDGWRLGFCICYDLRFSELFLEYARQKVDILLVPSAFLVPTGSAHWEVLLRARAIETQSYVLAAAQGGAHHGVGGGMRQTYGHSLIVDPWGKILREATVDDTILGARLSQTSLKNIRRQIPMAAHRRLVGMFSVWLVSSFFSGLLFPPVAHSQTLETQGRGSGVTQIAPQESIGRNRNYPGGKDEEDLVVQKRRDDPEQTVQLGIVQKQLLNDKRYLKSDNLVKPMKPSKGRKTNKPSKANRPVTEHNSNKNGATPKKP